MDVTNSTPLESPTPSPEMSAKQRALRQTIGEVVGITFYGQLLRSMQNSPLKGDVGHGGRGEDVFAGQLYMELAQRAGRQDRMPINEAMYRSLHKGLQNSK